MRSRVLVRSRGRNENNTTSTGVHKKRRKRGHVDSSAPTDRSLGHQDKVISFELPQLEALLQGIDPDQDDSSFLPHAATNVHPLPSASWQSSPAGLPGQVQDWQDPEDSAASAPLHFAPSDSYQGPGSSLQWADSCPVPTALPNVIRKTSSDSTIDPNTGKMLVYGKAMAHRTTHVELPSVSALFTDISSRVSQKSWLASATPPKQSNGNLVGGPVFKNGDMHSKCAAFPAGSNQVVQGVQSGGMQLTPPETVGARALAGLDSHVPSKPECQRTLPTAPSRAHQSVSIAVVRPLSSGSHSLAGPAAAPGRLATAQAGSCGQGARLTVSNPPPAVRRGFGGILNGVVKEAAETATKRPPVFRYEDFKPRDDDHSFKGVSRQRWSVQWQASIPKADKAEGEHFLGMFSQESAAARACDVATLKLHGASAQTNFPARDYEDGMEELEPISVLDVVMALQRQGAIGQYRHSRYQGVWQLNKSCWEARLEETRTQESTTND
ncbi:hypothetical protein WJX79_001849, partial [Trebouxia sp. C0005]